jgi:hypothetical protein
MGQIEKFNQAVQLLKEINYPEAIVNAKGKG